MEKTRSDGNFADCKPLSPDRIYVIFGRGAIETVFINKNKRATRVILHKIPV